jgi:hypothetical protein
MGIQKKRAKENYIAQGISELLFSTTATIHFIIENPANISILNSAFPSPKIMKGISKEHFADYFLIKDERLLHSLAIIFIPFNDILNSLNIWQLSKIQKTMIK